MCIFSWGCRSSSSVARPSRRVWMANAITQRFRKYPPQGIHFDYMAKMGRVDPHVRGGSVFKAVQHMVTAHAYFTCKFDRWRYRKAFTSEVQDKIPAATLKCTFHICDKRGCSKGGVWHSGPPTPFSNSILTPISPDRRPSSHIKSV